MNSRTHSFANPNDVKSAIAAVDGNLRWLHEMIAGRLPAPPAAETIGMRLESVEEGKATFSLRSEQWLANPLGVLHGGMTATLLDTALTVAIVTQLPSAKMATTTDLHVHFVRPVLPTGEKLTAVGTVVHLGTTLATAEGRVHDERGRLIAHATGSFAIIDTTSMKR
jgi:uncharacterized protein (TIGR00369 family)